MFLKTKPLQLPHLLSETISLSAGWPQLIYVTKDDLEILPSPSEYLEVCTATPSFCTCPESEPRAQIQVSPQISQMVGRTNTLLILLSAWPDKPVLTIAKVTVFLFQFPQ